MQTNTFHNSNL